MGKEEEEEEKEEEEEEEERKKGRKIGAETNEPILKVLIKGGVFFIIYLTCCSFSNPQLCRASLNDTHVNAAPATPSLLKLH